MRGRAVRAGLVEPFGDDPVDVVLDANGGFQVWIEEPDGYGEPMVWCWPVDGDPGGQPYPTQGGTWTVTPGAEPFSWQCNVYDIPAPEYRLELYKYTCVYTVDRNLGLPDLGTNPGCTPTQGVSFTASFGGNPGSAYYTDANGYINWPGVEGGPWSLTEGATPGYAAPKVYCGPPQSGETPEVTVTNLTVSGTLDQTTPHIICYWFNFEEPTENGRITVYKYQCPPGTTATDFGLLSESCTTPHNGIGFNLSGPATNISASTVAGTVDWTNLDQGAYTVTETTVLPGYETPLVFCGIVLQDGAPIDPGSVEWMSQTVTDRSIQLTLDNFPKRIVCYWYNIPSDYGEITIYKWTCPAGYDLDAWGADPRVAFDALSRVSHHPGLATPARLRGLRTLRDTRIRGLWRLEVSRCALAVLPVPIRLSKPAQLTIGSARYTCRLPPGAGRARRPERAVGGADRDPARRPPGGRRGRLGGGDGGSAPAGRSVSG